MSTYPLHPDADGTNGTPHNVSASEIEKTAQFLNTSSPHSPVQAGLPSPWPVMGVNPTDQVEAIAGAFTPITLFKKGNNEVEIVFQHVELIETSRTATSTPHLITVDDQELDGVTPIIVPCPTTFYIKLTTSPIGIIDGLIEIKSVPFDDMSEHHVPPSPEGPDLGLGVGGGRGGIYIWPVAEVTVNDGGNPVWFPYQDSFTWQDYTRDIVSLGGEAIAKSTSVNHQDEFRGVEGRPALVNPGIDIEVVPLPTFLQVQGMPVGGGGTLTIEEGCPPGGASGAVFTFENGMLKGNTNASFRPGDCNYTISVENNDESGFNSQTDITATFTANPDPTPDDYELSVVTQGSSNKLTFVDCTSPIPVVLATIDGNKGLLNELTDTVIQVGECNPPSGTPPAGYFEKTIQYCDAGVLKQCTFIVKTGSCITV